jgi:hypothetical protein
MGQLAPPLHIPLPCGLRHAQAQRVRLRILLVALFLCRRGVLSV